MAETSSARVLETALANFRGELTVADAATRSGLPLREAEQGLRSLTADYSGHLAATEKGELIYSFPKGLVRPPEARAARRFGRALVKGVAAGARLLVRAWVSVVLVGYALVFLAILIALALRGGDDRDGPSPMDGIGMVLRIVAEAFFWTFHPWSPVLIGSEPGWLHARTARQKRVPFYERVNRFVFGPPKAKPDPREEERQILSEIRRQKGRIAPGDVMRFTGGSREEAERQLLRLVVDYEGDLSVSDTGAILYSFPHLRTTAGLSVRAEVARPVWNRRADMVPLTGNTAGSNVLFTLINGFNLVASGVVLTHGLTLERLALIFAQLRTIDPAPLPAADGIPLVLGAIPFAFSLALFALPLWRLIRRPAEVREVARENGWREMLRVVLGSTSGPSAQMRMDYTPDEMKRAWAAASGRLPTEAELESAVRDLGGETTLDAVGAIVYRFETLDRELAALVRERARAEDEEAAAGEVIFSSADAGSGIREPAPQAEPRSSTGPEATTPTRPSSEAARAVPRLEEKREPIEFLDRLMAEAKRRRRE